MLIRNRLADWKLQYTQLNIPSQHPSGYYIIITIYSKLWMACSATNDWKNTAIDQSAKTNQSY